jgi:ATP adenylyltransferase/5',5'''-P-1,P-4-tetraphosphate phosphorylase II
MLKFGELKKNFNKRLNNSFNILLTKIWIIYLFLLKTKTKNLNLNNYSIFIDIKLIIIIFFFNFIKVIY